MRQMNWTVEKHGGYIRMVNDECLRLKTLDWTKPEPFRGPLDRFRWRVTASYFMCWYTMQVNGFHVFQIILYTRIISAYKGSFSFFELDCQNS